VRATGQFARTVFAELTRAGYRHEDVLRFVNELMALLSEEVRSKAAAEEPPGVFDAEAGVLDRATILEVLDFELKRASKERRMPPVTVLGIDVVIPSWVASPVRAEVHGLLARGVYQRLRSSDAVGKLGPERYLVVLPESKQGVVAALRERLKTLLCELDAVPDQMALRLRWVRDEDRRASAAGLVADCFSRPAEGISRATSSYAGASADAAGAARAERDGLDSVVLCLGGGAARAASHAGVFAALEERGVAVAGIAGASGGAIVGAMRATGMPPEEIIARFSGFSKTRVYRAMRRAYATFLRDSRRQGRRARERVLGESSLPFYSEAKLAAVPQELFEEFIEYFVGPDRDLSALPVPMAVAATDLVEGRSIVLSHGSLHVALKASSAVPGLFPLQKLEQGYLADGAAVAEVPIGAAHVLGLAAPVVAVHLEHPRERVTSYRSSAEVVSRMSGLIHRELVNEQLGRARFLMSVPVQEIGWLEFDRAQESAAVGKRAAQHALERDGLRRGNKGDAER
jgi:NTE family protein